MIVLYPTDTLYGLGVDATDPEAIRRLKELKGRDEGKAISIVVSDVAMMRQYADVTPLAEKLITAFLPGKLTIILNAKNLPPELSNDGTIGIRMIDHPVPLQLIKELGKPVTATSANVSGMPTYRTVAEILAQFGEKSDLIYQVTNCPSELPPSEPSTVVDARGDIPIIIREAAIPKVAIFKVMV